MACAHKFFYSTAQVVRHSAHHEVVYWYKYS